ncbi:centromere protein F [Patella vulgata]|uniref:centromere protein F n=1 Tax=Patella vulgata TaxID=6465 RepID=UPI0024A7C4F9|nr:centromere protein F [Patella vulgata]
MSWAVDEWKDGLPAKALQKIGQLESQLERLKREKDQKQFQFESLEQSLSVQKRKLEEEKSLYATLKHDNQVLEKDLGEIEKKRAKLAQELQTKDNHISCLTGQLSHTKTSVDNEISKSVHLKSDLEHAQQEHLEFSKKFEKLTADHAKLQEYSNHQKTQIESQTDRVKCLENDLKKLQGEMGKGTNQSIYTGSATNTSPTATECSSLKSKIAELTSQHEKDVESYKSLEAELKVLQSQAGTDNSKLVAELSNLKKEKESLTLRLENKTTASDNKVQQMGRELNDNRGMTGMQVEKMEKLIDRLKKENEVLNT